MQISQLVLILLVLYFICLGDGAINFFKFLFLSYIVLKQSLGNKVLSASSLCRIKMCFLITPSVSVKIGLYFVTNLILMTWLVSDLVFLASSLDILQIFLITVHLQEKVCDLVLINNFYVHQHVIHSFLMYPRFVKSLSNIPFGTLLMFFIG